MLVTGDRSLDAVQRAAKVGAVIPRTPLDQLVVVAGQTRNDGLGDQEVCNGSMTSVWRALELLPGNKMLYEDRFERVQVDEVFCQRLQIVPKRWVD